MGSKNKLKRFRENDTFKNVIQPTREVVLKSFPLKGKWHTFFNNDHPIILELGCGKGEYTIDLAKKNPNINYIGVDIKGARFWRGAKTAIEEKIENVAFLRTQIELIDLCFAANEVTEIWITFPDPQIKHTRIVHRLTNESFLKKYHTILKKDGIVHLKTDSEFMHGYTLGLLQGLKQDILYAHHHIYNNSESPKEATSVQTFYEKQYLKNNKAITYLKFKLNL
ncbi:MAG: tRNA (guanosine(46)-N7)-methyltransferase TrmB [Flavobacteriaceae bacterium]